MMEIRQSNFALFLGCKRSFYLQVVENLQHENAAVRPRKHYTRDTGTLFHKPLELYYRGELPENVTREMLYDICLNEAIEIGGLFQEEHNEDTDEMPAMFDYSDWYKAIKMASIVTEGYFRWVEETSQDLRYNVHAVEERMALPLEGSNIVITGKPDLILDDELTKEMGVLDTKSVARLDAIRPGDFQLLTYCVLVWKTLGRVPEWAGHNQMVRNMQTAKSSPPYYDRKYITINEDILTQHYEMLCNTAIEIEAFIKNVDRDNHHLLAPPNMTGECSWKCGVQDLCDHMHDGNDVWTYMADTYYIQRTELI